MNNKLKGRIREVCGSDKEFAKQIGLSPVAISLKLSNHRGWKRDQIAKAIEVLSISKTEVWDYFFEANV